METTTNTKKDLFTAMTDVGHHAAMAQAIGRAVMNLLPDKAGAFEGSDDVILLVCALMDELELEHKAVEALSDAYCAGRSESGDSQ